MSYIEAENLQKTFTLRKGRKGHLIREKVQVEALCGVSFSIQKGELVGYIGPNGAGKSTTVKILSGILTPSGGKCVINGRIPYETRKEHVRHIGVVFGQRTQLWWDVPPEDSYLLLKDIYRIPENEFHQRLEELSETLDLNEIRHVPLRQLSLGQRMRAEVAGSLLHRPELLFLDEPTIGLDAVSKLKLREFLKEENRRHQTTVLLTTHDMEDISELCSRVMVLGKGKLLYDGKLPSLLEKYDTLRSVTVRYQSKASTLPLPDACTKTVREDGTLIITYDKTVLPTAKLLEILQAQGDISEMTVQPQSIDHLIARMYEDMRL